MRYYIGIMILFFFFSSCQRDEELQILEEQDAGTERRPAMMEGCLRVKFKAGVEAELNVVRTKSGVASGIAAVDLAGTGLHVYRMERVFPYAGKFEERHRKYGLHLWYDIYFDEKVSTRSAVESYRKLPEVESVGEVPEASLCDYERVPELLDPLRSSLLAEEGEGDGEEQMPFDDPNLPSMWHYHNAGEEVNHLTGALKGADIGLFPAWERETGSPEVIVAVMDGGIQFDHPDLSDNMWFNEAEMSGKAGVDDDNNGYVDDVYGFNFTTLKVEKDDNGRDIYTNGAIDPENHGTHCAGTIAAVNNNKIGICGIAGGSGQGDGVRLMSCQMFKGAGGMKTRGNENAEAAKPSMYVYAADMGAVISSNSWTFGGFPEEDFKNSATAVAIDYFIDNAGVDLRGNQNGPMKGGMVIFAAANDNTDTKAWPAAYHRCFTVASIGHNFKRAPYSNFGDWVDICAPGGDQGYGHQYGVLSTVTGGQYDFYQGTSMACPHVAGCAALVLSKFQAPGYLPEDVRERLENSAEDIVYGYNKNYAGKLGVGLVNVGKALTPPSAESPASSELVVVDAYDGWAIVEWEVKEAPDGPMNKYVISWSKHSMQQAGMEEETKTKSVVVRKIPAGTVMRDTITGLELGATYFFSLVAYDRWGGKSEPAPEVSKTVTVNRPPLVKASWNGTLILNEGSERLLDIAVTEPEGQRVTGCLSAGREWMTVGQSEDGMRLKLAPGYKDAGSYGDTLKISDQYGKTVCLPFTVEVLYKEVAPLRKNSFEDMQIPLKGRAVRFNLNDYFEDSKGRELVFEVESSDASVVVAKRLGKELTVEGRAVGRASVLVRALNAGGYSVSQRFVVEVVPAVVDETELLVYPNPVIKELNIRLAESHQGEAVLRLYNSSGRQLVARKVTVSQDGYILDMSGMQAGTYLLELSAASGEWRKNIIKL